MCSNFPWFPYVGHTHCKIHGFFALICHPLLPDNIFVIFTREKNPNHTLLYQATNIGFCQFRRQKGIPLLFKQTEGNTVALSTKRRSERKILFDIVRMPLHKSSPVKSVLLYFFFTISTFILSILEFSVLNISAFIYYKFNENILQY